MFRKIWQSSSIVLVHFRESNPCQRLRFLWQSVAYFVLSFGGWCFVLFFLNYYYFYLTEWASMKLANLGLHRCKCSNLRHCCFSFL